ncbi:MAG: riboflavin biosynthesis protein RibF [Anaerolineaceae bacterium]|nr:riboflavin biosynthesis protein RibF [Anaerolineaceae bacterium]
MNEALTTLFGPELPNHSAVTIGAFDGLHLGHRHIIGNTVTYARSKGISAAAILFDPLPSIFFGRLGPDDRIMLRSEQETTLREMGIDRVIFLPFSQKIADLTPHEFLDAMQAVLHCECLVMGEDFSLGKGRSGSASVLAGLGSAYGFSAEIISKDEMDGDVISSTRIRKLLHQGKLPEANRLLGYPFFFSSKIIHGDARGRKLGFPTLNVKIPPEKLKLPNGVYAVYNYIDDVKYASVTNIGVRPTFGLDDKGTFVESYLLNTAGNFYGESSRLEFIEMLREEKRFSSADELKAQITKDILHAQQLLT